MNDIIPSWTYKYDLEKYREEYLNVFNRVLNSGRLLFGKELENFEKNFSEYIGTSYAVGCDNATNGIFLSLISIGISKGDYVITVPNTAIPTVSAIKQAGAIPIFVDVNENALLDPKNLYKKYFDGKEQNIVGIDIKWNSPVNYDLKIDILEIFVDTMFYFRLSQFY